MSESKYREWILDTIDSLRSRKARPDLERICRMVRRRHGSEPDRTCAELEKLIQEQTVLKVNYKGSISYRNAAKVQRRSRKKDDVTLTTAARRSTVEEASHSDLSNGDSAFGPVDQDEEDLEVCWGWCEEACSTSSHLIVTSRLTKLTCRGKSKARVVSGLQKKPRLFVSKWGVVRGAICKCTQNCRRRGASVGPRSSAAEVETKKKKTEGAREVRVWHILHQRAGWQALWTGDANAQIEDRKSCTVLSVRNNPSHHYQQQKALFKPQTQRCAKGRGTLPS